MKRRSAQTRRSRKALSILELLMAVTVFALVSVAVFSVFMAGTRSYDATHRHAAVIQRGRYVMDMLEQDVMRLFYRDEDQYNVQSRKVIEEYEMTRAQLESNRASSADWERFQNRYFCQEENEADCLKDPNYVGNPFDKGKLIDLQFVGEDHGDTDKITFAIRRPFDVGNPYILWGLARVHYTVERDYLIRTVETVEVNPRTWDGQVMPKKVPPEHAIVAQGIKYFDLSYGFWWDSQWYEVPSWSSSDRRMRNSQYLMGEYPEDEERTDRFGPGGVPLASDAGRELVNLMASMPYDRVPTYVRLRLGIGDPENPGRITELERIFRIPNSQETWVVNQSLDEKEREMEQTLRDQDYRPVYPGALRKR